MLLKRVTSTPKASLCVTPNLSRWSQTPLAILPDMEPIENQTVDEFLEKYSGNKKVISGSFLLFQFQISTFPDGDEMGAIFNTFEDLGFIKVFKIPKPELVRFLITAKNGYRPLPYHNWTHGASVAHFAYLLIKRLKLIDHYITKLQAFSLLLAAITHDIDHPGTNNVFQQATQSELYEKYKTQESILERHHLSLTFALLNDAETNVIKNLSFEEYQEFMEYMRWNILATDISRYLRTRDSHFWMIKDFQNGRRDHQLALMSLVMSASDCNDAVKGWENFRFSTAAILGEFFAQGDLEKSLGMQPLILMDREKAYIPEIEYNFLHGIVLPIFTCLADRFRLLHHCVNILQRILENWELATSVFDAHPEITDKLDILLLDDLRESNLRAQSLNVAKMDDLRRLSTIDAGAQFRELFTLKSAISVCNYSSLTFASTDEEDDERMCRRSCSWCLKFFRGNPRKPRKTLMHTLHWQ